ncbi:hypothetical protein [Rhizobium sp. NFR03]|uniref:hypothetical protein n=1 Tax=Rhizobium sp. NFR03 TaxID=1566263 RepID=UPI0008AB95D8|nr:hypothetical protein [Rhizobium sp. NFR03]SES41486.1 hypothetical protein SAMN03159406_04193 [Rhizobium sp. NFR03]
MSDDWDEIKDWSTKVYVPYEVTLIVRFDRPVSTMHSAKIGRITVKRFAYGIPVTIQ